MHKCKLQALQRALRGRIPVTLLQPVAAVSIMPRSYIDNFSYFLGAYSGLLIGFSRESWFFLTSLTSINGWKSLYVGTSPNCAKKVDHGEPKAVKTSSVSVAGIGRNPIASSTPGQLRLTFPGHRCRSSRDQQFSRNETSRACHTTSQGSRILKFAQVWQLTRGTCRTRDQQA